MKRTVLVLSASLACAVSPACYLQHGAPSPGACGDTWSGRYEVWTEDEVVRVDVLLGAPSLRCEVDGAPRDCFTGHGTIWIELSDEETLVAELVSCVGGEVPASLSRDGEELEVRIVRVGDAR